jgi:hypothetical protein
MKKCFVFVVADEIMNLFARSIFTACKKPKTGQSQICVESTQMKKCFVFVVANEIMNLFARSIFTACKKPKTEQK